MEKIKTIIASLIIVGTLSFAPVAHGATDASIQSQIDMWQGYIVKLEALVRLCELQIKALEAQVPPEKVEKQMEWPVEKVTVYTVTLPAGSSVKEPKSDMTFEELRFFTANLFKVYTSPYRKLINGDEDMIVEFLKTNGYKVVKEKK